MFWKSGFWNTTPISFFLFFYQAQSDESRRGEVRPAMICCRQVDDSYVKKSPLNLWKFHLKKWSRNVLVTGASAIPVDLWSNYWCLPFLSIFVVPASYPVFVKVTMQKRDPNISGPSVPFRDCCAASLVQTKNPPNSLQTTSAMVGLQAWPAEIKMPNQAPELQLVVVGDVLQNVSKDGSSINYHAAHVPKKKPAGIFTTKYL